MNSFIFSFKENTQYLKEVITLKNILFTLFLFVYYVFIFTLASSGIEYGLLVGFEGTLLIIIYLLVRKYRTQFKIIILSGLIFFLIGETYFRLSYFNIPGIIRFSEYIPAGINDPLSTFKFDANTYTGLRRGSYIYKGGNIVINELGFRTQSRSFKKAPGVLRIVVCGTSLSMGAGLNEGDNYASQLENMLNESIGPAKCEVINLSMPAYGIDDILSVIKRFGMMYNPDIVIIEGSGKAFGRPGLHSQQEFKGGKIELLQMILKRPNAKLFFLEAIKRDFFPYLKYLWTKADYKEFEFDKNSINNLESKLIEIKRILGGVKIFIVAIRPMRFLEKNMDVPDEIVEFCRKQGLFLIDTFHEDYGLNAKEMVIYVGDRHPNKKAHAVYARTILKLIKPAVDDRESSMLKGRF